MAQAKPQNGQLAGLMEAARRNRGRDSVGPLLQPATWSALGQTLAPRVAAPGELLITQGASDRSLYFIELGTLRIFRSDRNHRLQLAVLGAGSVVGEGTFFAAIERNANAEAAEDSLLWELTPERFAALLQSHPAAACDVAMCLGAILSTRMLSVAGRLAIT